MTAKRDTIAEHCDIMPGVFVTVHTKRAKRAVMKALSPESEPKLPFQMYLSDREWDLVVAAFKEEQTTCRG